MNNVRSTAKAIYQEALIKAERDDANLKEVAALLRDASRLGSPDADYALGTWYLHGKHFKINWTKGALLLKKASKAGHSSACFDLAVCFETGRGTKKDTEKALQLYMEAALRGDNIAYREVARCYWHGVGARKNRALADLWGSLHESKSGRNPLK